MRYSYNLVMRFSYKVKHMPYILIIRMTNAFGSKLELKITLKGSLNWF